MALAILLLVRFLAGSGWAQISTSAGTFALWMLVFQDGFLHHFLDPRREWIADWTPLLLAVAAFYTIVITLLANAGRIK